MSENTPNTQWMHRNDLIRPGVHIPRETWEQFEQAVAVENFLRAQDGKPPVTRTGVLIAFMKKWSEKKLHDTQ